MRLHLVPLIFKKSKAKCLLFLLLFNMSGQITFSQSQNEKGRIGISIPVVYNYSTGVYYQTGNRKTPGGSAFSYGLNLNYIHPVDKSIFIKAGIGFFKQNFGIERPLHYRDSLKLGYFTQTYNYKTINWLLGLGIKKTIGDKTVLSGSIDYSGYNTFNQKYIIYKQLETELVNKKAFSLGYVISVDAGIDRHVSKKMSAGCHLILPIYTHWKDDLIFINTYYSPDQQKIAKNIFSAGLSFSAYYHF